MNNSYKILHLQNSNSAVEAAENELRKGNIKFDHCVVTNEEEYLKALDKYKPDIILCDYSSANPNTMGALKIIKSQNLNIPFIIISTNPVDNNNIDVFKVADDNFLVNDMLQHLPVAIEKAIRRHSLEKERSQIKKQITEKEKSSARHLSQLSGKFLQATKTAGIGVWEYSFENDKVETDEILLSHYGLTTSTYTGSNKQLIQYLSPFERVRVLAEFKEAVANRTDLLTEFKVTWDDGSVHYLSTSAHLQCDDNNEPCRLIGTSQDITSAKLARQQLSETSIALQKTLSELKKIMDSSLDVICSMDEHGNFINVSAASEKLWGYKPFELIGKPYIDLVYKEDKAKTLQAIADITSGINMTNFENYQVCKNGSLVPIVLSARWDENDKTLYCIAREATEKKQADAQLLVSQQRFKDLVQGGSDLIVIVNHEGNYVYVSPNSMDVLGFAAEDFIGKNTFSFMHPDDVEMAIASFSRIANEKKIVVPPIRFQHSNGSWRWLDSSVTNFIDNPGINGIVINARDITDRKIAEDKIKESEAFSLGVLNSLSSHIAVINAEGTIVKVNKSWNDFALNNGATILTKVGEGANYFDSCTNVKDPIAGDTLKGIKEVLAGTLPEFYIEYPCHSSTEKRWFYTRVKKFVGAEPLALIEHQYITERIKSEQKLISASDTLQETLKDLNLIMESSLDIICSINAEGNFVRVSAASEKIWGFKPEELIGRKFMDLVYHEDKQATAEMAFQVMSGLPVTMFENRYVHKNSSIVPLLWSARWDDKSQSMYCIAKDAREKKRLEKAFLIEKQRFHDLFLHAPSSMGSLKGKDHVYESANSLYLQLIGRENIIGKTVKEVLPELADQGFIDRLDDVYNTGETFTGKEMKVKFNLNRDGIFVEKYLNFIYQAHRNEDEEIDGIFFFANDVTEQVISRREIELSERKYRQIVETAQEGMWLIDDKNITTFVNAKMCEILQYDPEQMVGKGLFEFMDDEGKTICENVLKNMHRGDPMQLEFKFISKTKKEVWTHLSTNSLFGNDGSYIGALAMITDITERRGIEKRLAHSENSLREAQKIAQLGNWEIDLQSNVHFWSDEMFTILGINPGDVAPSLEALILFIPDEDKLLVKEKMQEAVKDERDSVLHFRIKQPNEEIRYVHSQWRFEFDKANNPIKVVGIMQDVTKLKIAEIERTKMVKDLIQRNKDLEQFNYIVSHNLRAPVANIIGFADALTDIAYPTSLHKEFLAQLSVSVNKLDQVIRDITGVLVVRQKVNENKELLSLSTIVENIQISIQNLITQYNVTIQTDFKEIDEILSIRSFIHSILYNLISNGIKYRIPGKPPVISIKSTKIKEGIELVYTDNGLGIDLKKNKDNLFGLYKRFHLNVEGKGLGLFMTKSQIDTLGGTIEAASEVNHGITFKICLPL